MLKDFEKKEEKKRTANKERAASRERAASKDRAASRERTVSRERAASKEKDSVKKKKPAAGQQASTSKGQKKKSLEPLKGANKRKATCFVPTPCASPTHSLSSTQSELSIPIASHRSKDIHPVHDLDEDLICSAGNEEVLLREESNSDEYDFTDDEDDYSGIGSDYRAAFHLPIKTKASKIVGVIMINETKYYVFQFEDSKIYYVEFEAANEKFKEQVKKFYNQKKCTPNDGIRKDL